jgi:acyl dehydratase
VTALSVGTELPAQEFVVTREDLRRYAAASGDHNPIHQDDAFARAIGLPGVVAHGMYTLALVARAAELWAGGAGRVRDLGAKFTRPVVVPEGEGAVVVVSGVVRDVADDGAVTVALEVTCAGEKVLGGATAVLRG